MGLHTIVHFYNYGHAEGKQNVAKTNKQVLASTSSGIVSDRFGTDALLCALVGRDCTWFYSYQSVSFCK